MPAVHRTPGAWPLDLEQGVADVEHECSSCGRTFSLAAPVVTDWLDHTGATAQHALARGVDCPECGAIVPFAAPLIQLRHGDIADLLIALPPDSSLDTDTDWISAVKVAFPKISMAERIVPIRADWWPGIASQPLGPILAGVVTPVVPASSEDIAAWRTSVRESVPVSTVVKAVHRLALTETYADSQVLVGEHPELIQPRWRATVRAVAAALVDAQVDPDARRAVENRTLRRLRTLVLFRGGAPAEYPDEVRALIDAATGHSPSDDCRLGAVTAAAEALNIALGDGAEVAAALTSLARALYDSPNRSRAHISEAIRIATRAANIAGRVFGADHQLVVMNRLNALAMAADLLGGDTHEVEEAMDELRTFALRPAVLTSHHLPDVLTNMAGLVHRRRDLARAARSELQLELLLQAQRAARLLDPDNDHLRFVIATNLAATYGARVAGATNAATAVDALRATDAASQGLTSVDQLMRMTTEISIEFAASVADGRHDVLVAVIERCSALREAAIRHGADNEAAINALSNSASITTDLVRRLDAPSPQTAAWLRDALGAAGLAVERAAAHLGLTSNAHLTALIGLGNLQSEALPDHADAAATYQQAIDLADGHSDLHLAVAWRNLGTIHLEAAHWLQAAAALRHASEARRRLVGSVESDHLILGEVADSEDLAGREALAWVLAEQPQEAVATTESSRAHLLRRRLAITPPRAEPAAHPSVTTIHLSGSDIGTSLVIRGVEGMRASGAYAIGREVGESAAQLLRARSRASRSAALRRLGMLVQPVVADIMAATTGEADLRLILSGGWANVPLHVFLGEGDPGQALIVRYLPSEGIASELRTRSANLAGEAVALIDPDGDLPLAAAERIAFTRAFSAARTYIGSVTRATALEAIRDAHTVHLACHARYDAHDPTCSYLSLGSGQRLTFADLLAAADAQRLRLVVASACQAGASGTWNPDEMTAVAHGFLHVGARAVVTALWDVNDLPAALLVCALYASPQFPADPAAALAEAQHWLRTLTPQTAWTPQWLPSDLDNRLRGYLDRLEPHEAPFADGIDWGSFAYVGP